MTNDLKLALRRLRGAPGFASAAILTLALAIGANAAIFSFADAVLFRPLPYEDPDSVFNILMETPRTGSRYTLTPYEYLRVIGERARTVQGVGLLEQSGRLTVTTADGSDFVPIHQVTANYFDLLGARAERGRLLGEGDATAGGRPTVLTWATFVNRFGADDAVVGTDVVLGDQTFDVVGVLPADFVFPAQLLGTVEIVTLMEPVAAGDSGGTFTPIVRLRGGFTVAEADAELAALAGEVASAETEGLPVLNEVRPIVYGAGQPVMRFMLAASVLVLLIGCANLANMMLARTRMREREIGVQAALGAGRVGRVRALVIEAVIIGFAGSVAALLASSLTFDYLRRQVPAVALGQAPVGVSPRVVLFTLGLGILGGLVFAAIPAWRASRLDAQVLLRAGGEPGGRRAIGRPLLAAEVGLAIVLVFGAAVTARAFVSVLSVPLGFDPQNVVAVRLMGFPADDGMSREDFYMRAIDALEQRGDVIVAGGGGSIPFVGGVGDEGVVSPETGERLDASIFHVLPGYFATAGVPLVRGRLPTRADVTAQADIAVLPESTARVLFGTRDPLGETVVSNVGRRVTVVGIVGEVVHSIGGTISPPVYVIPGEATRLLYLIARTRSANNTALEGIRQQIGSLAPGIPIEAYWWDEAISDVTAIRNPRFQTIVLGSFAGLALGLTALGVFAVVAFIVAARMRDLGIRVAIGATPGSIVTHMIGHVAIPTLVGLVAGLAATRVLARLAEAQLYEVDTNDPAILAAAAAAVLIASLVAAYFPARRAGRVDPMTVLRMD